MQEINIEKDLDPAELHLILHKAHVDPNPKKTANSALIRLLLQPSKTMPGYLRLEVAVSDGVLVEALV